MSQNKLAKLRNADVFKALMRVLDEYRIPKEDYHVLDKRPHPMLTVRYCGAEREMSIPSTPKTRGKAPVAYSAQLRRLLKEMQMAALGGGTVQGTVAQEVSDVQEQPNLPLISPSAPAGNAPTMSTREIAELLDIRHDSVKRTVERLAQKQVVRFTPLVETSHAGAGARPVEVYLVDERDSYVVVAQLSPEFTARLVDFWQGHKNQQPVKIPTTAEAFAHAFQMIANAERTQMEQARALQRLEEKVERVEIAQSVMRARPGNAEGITHIRIRIGKMHGLSISVIDEVMRQSPYAPKPAGMVRNDHVDADGSLYAVYWQKDVTATFNRFVAECVSVTALMFTHPFIEGRFRVAGKVPA